MIILALALLALALGTACIIAALRPTPAPTAPTAFRATPAPRVAPTARRSATTAVVDLAGLGLGRLEARFAIREIIAGLEAELRAA